MPLSIRASVSSHILHGAMEASGKTHFPSGIWEGSERAFPHPHLGNQCPVALRRDEALCRASPRPRQHEASPTH